LSLNVRECADFLHGSNVEELKETFHYLERIEVEEINLIEEDQLKLVRCLGETRSLISERSLISAAFEAVTFSGVGLRGLAAEILANNPNLQSLKMRLCLQTSDIGGLRRLGRLVAELPRLSMWISLTTT
jgi:hypothetical protein